MSADNGSQSMTVDQNLVLVTTTTFKFVMHARMWMANFVTFVAQHSNKMQIICQCLALALQKSPATEVTASASFSIYFAMVACM